MPKVSAETWIQQLCDTLPAYLQRLAVPEHIGAFLPCERGVTKYGKAARLGFSCFALKIYYTTGLWERLPDQIKNAWRTSIQSFQTAQSLIGSRFHDGAFIDPPLFAFILSSLPPVFRFVHRFIPFAVPTAIQQLLYAETKQAIATLAQIDDQPLRPYRGIPASGHQVRRFLEKLDWTKPWHAGGQAACLAFFLATQAPLLYDPQRCHALQNAWSGFIEGIVDKGSGGYFRGPLPVHANLVSGAMKIISGLDWLGIPIHYPEALIDTCLQALPPPEACHIVNTIYVLFQCLQQTSYKRDKVQSYCTEILRLIRRFYHRSGGFSYWIAKSQTHYYDVPISSGYDESDIHGTCLLTWALAMIFHLMEDTDAGWHIIKP
ncbi:MAG: hypothetical protein N3B18_03115 [Desulfobacterota bacterium]|nr:hypothetical protein [Thermodesulfobacteriota bacterium]